MEWTAGISQIYPPIIGQLLLINHRAMIQVQPITQAMAYSQPISSQLYPIYQVRYNQFQSQRAVSSGTAILPSQLGRNLVQTSAFMCSLKTLRTLSGVTSKYFWISEMGAFSSSCIFSWILQKSVRLSLPWQVALYSVTFQKARAAMVLMRVSGVALLAMFSHISIMASSSNLRILRRAQTRMMRCLGLTMGTKSILPLSTAFISLTRSFQTLMFMPSILLRQNSSKQLSFWKHALQMEQAAMFLRERMFLCRSLLIFFSSPFSSSTSDFYSTTSFSLSTFSSCFFMILRMVRKRAVAVSMMFWFSFSTKQQSPMNFRPFLKFLSKLASFSSQMPPPARLDEQIAVKRFSFLSSPSQCMTSLSQLMGWTSMKVQFLIPQTRAPFQSRTEKLLHFGHSILKYYKLPQTQNNLNRQIHPNLTNPNQPSHYPPLSPHYRAPSSQPARK